MQLLCDKIVDVGLANSNIVVADLLSKKKKKIVVADHNIKPV